MSLGFGAQLGLAAASKGIDAAFGGLASRREYKNAKKMWQMQAEYNSPVQQIERLKAAGLNPHLVYGQSVQGATGNMSSHPEPQNFEHLRGFGTDLINNSMALQQNANATAKSQAEVDNLRVQNDLLLANITGKHLDNDLARETFQDAVERASLTNEKISSDIYKTKADTEKAIEETRLTLQKQGLTEAQTNLVVKQTEKVAQEIYNLLIDGKLKEAQRAKIEAETHWIKLGVHNSRPLERLLYELLDETGAKEGVKQGAGKIIKNMYIKPAGTILKRWWQAVFGD